ncbi:MAG: hypothetical protein ACLP0J_26970 [Solirubrobacteraceae bacterium]
MLIADDHVATRMGVRVALEAVGFCVVAEVDAADDVVGSARGAHAARLCEPDWRWFPAAASIGASGFPARAAPRGALLYPGRSRDELEDWF